MESGGHNTRTTGHLDTSGCRSPQAVTAPTQQQHEQAPPGPATTWSGKSPPAPSFLHTRFVCNSPSQLPLLYKRFLLFQWTCLWLDMVVCPELQFAVPNKFILLVNTLLFNGFRLTLPSKNNYLKINYNPNSAVPMKSNEKFSI